MRAHHIIQQFFGVARIDPVLKNILWDVIGAFGKYRLAIEFEVKRFAFFVFLGDELYGSEFPCGHPVFQ